MVGKDLIMATLLGSGASSGGGGIPQEDIDAAFAALAAKGVTVPDGATSADLDDLIASIKQTGGETIFGRKFETGTFTPAAKNTNIQVQHTLAAVPTAAIWWTEEDAYADTTQSYALLGIAIFFDETNWYGSRALITKASATSTSSVSASGKYKTSSGATSMAGSPTSNTFSGASVYGSATAEKVSFHCDKYFPEGVTYKYILFGGLPQ